MRLRHLIIVLSLLANGVLFAAYMAKSHADTLRRENAISSEAAAKDTAATRAKATAAAASSASEVAPFKWSGINPDDLDELVRRLQAAGFSKREIRLILSRRIDQMTSPFAVGDGKTVPYWQRAFRARTPNGAAADEYRRKIAERSRLMRKYVDNADNLLDDPDALSAAKRRWGDLTADKLKAISTIESDYADLNLNEWARQRTRPGEETNLAEARRLLDQEQLADIAKVLTPEEFEDYRLRTSPLRYQLEGFRPTEAEYKTIYAIKQAFASRYADPKLTLEKLAALQAEMTAQVKAALGDERSRDFDAVTNYNYNSNDKTAELVNQLGLPARVAVEIRQAQQDFTQKAKDIRAAADLSAADRNAQLDALARQAETLLSTKLGADGFEAYADEKGEWLRAIKPTPDGT